MNKRTWMMAWFVGALVTAVVVACGSQAVEFGASSGGPAGGGLSCAKANQCPGNQGCVNGSCAACRDAIDCTPGQSCSGGVCGPCTANAQCAAGTACVNGACGGCTTNEQCTDGKTCVLGTCGPCTANSQCRAGLACVDGKCACTVSSQCASGQECVDSVCKVPPGGSDGGTDGGPIKDSGVDAADACAGKPVFQTVQPNVPAIWSSGGKLGVAAGNDYCEALTGGVAGASHFCSYAEIRVAEARGELNGAALRGKTYWVHRTTPEVVGGVTNSGGAGARCQDWTYNTNHVGNGEFMTIDGAGAITYDLATADKTILGASPSAGTNRLCGGVTRSLLCCHPKCP